MGDDRHCFIHVDDNLAGYLLDENDEKLGWDLPDDDIKVPLHLLPPYQDEDDDTVLPSQTHPSYPYGNPYRPRANGGPSGRTTGSATTSSTSLISPIYHPTSYHSGSLATSLTVLNLRHLHSITTFGEPRDRSWNEMGLDSLLRIEERVEKEDLTKIGTAEAAQPTGQNAGDHPVDEDGNPEPVDLVPDD